MAANLYNAIAVSIATLQQAVGFRVHTNFKKCLKEDMDFYQVYTF